MGECVFLIHLNTRLYSRYIRKFYFKYRGPTTLKNLANFLANMKHCEEHYLLATLCDKH